MPAGGNKVALDSSGSYVENHSTGRRIPLEEASGTYRVDVEHLSEAAQGFARHA